MKRSSPLLIILLICFCVIISFGQKQTPEVLLNVEIVPYLVINPDNTQSCYGICPNGGIYMGSAIFNKYGHFDFNSGTRLVNFNAAPSPESRPNVKARSFNTKTPYAPLQSMENGQSQCIGVGWEFAVASNVVRNIGYRYFQNSGTTSYVNVTRIDANTWTMEPRNQAQAACALPIFEDNKAIVRDLQTVRNKTSVLGEGFYEIPFFLRLTRQ